MESQSRSKTTLLQSFKDFMTIFKSEKNDNYILEVEDIPELEEFNDLEDRAIITKMEKLEKQIEKNDKNSKNRIVVSRNEKITEDKEADKQAENNRNKIEIKNYQNDKEIV